MVKVLDLFAGLCGWSAPFAARGHEVFSVDLDERFDVSSHADILTLTAADLPWKPDIILASPPCESFSVLRIGRNWHYDQSWSGSYADRRPKTKSAEIGLALVGATLRLIDELAPSFWVIENPRAAKSRKDPRWEAFAASVGQDVTDPAVRAIIPAELALDVCLAAERDLEAGARPIPTTIWSAA